MSLQFFYICSVCFDVIWKITENSWKVQDFSALYYPEITHFWYRVCQQPSCWIYSYLACGIQNPNGLLINKHFQNRGFFKAIHYKGQCWCWTTPCACTVHLFLFWLFIILRRYTVVIVWYWSCKCLYWLVSIWLVVCGHICSMLSAS